MKQSKLVEKATLTLDDIARKGADQIASALQAANKTNYINFVSMLYHYSVPGEPQLNKAAVASPTLEMQAFYAKLAKEESDHDIVAIKDLKTMGYKVGVEDELVESYHKHWDDFTVDKTYEYLGMNVVIENSIHYLSQTVADMVERLELGKKECRWIRIHCDVDKEHGEEALSCAQQHMSESTVELMLKGAREDMKRFTDMFVDALRKETPLPFISA